MRFLERNIQRLLHLHPLLILSSHLKFLSDVNKSVVPKYFNFSLNLSAFQKQYLIGKVLFEEESKTGILNRQNGLRIIAFHW